MDGGERGTDVEADERGLARAERAARLDDLVERLAADELGPQPHPAIVFLGTVDLHHMLVPQARQAAGFLHETRVRIATTLRDVVLMQ